ncbi:cysteine peptidase family C39 domain-containing protein, partial [Piscinibacter sp.]|uniref:cysteine peptidase family C39 domain-containing protein n=1 Tax=Piscinibacter sp. TaxID=1903157 RepID=UPI002C3C715C
MADHATLAPPSPTGTVQRLREDLIHPDPLLDCLIEVCRLHGQAASRASLSAGLPLGADNQGRLTLELAERAAARAGMSARLQRVALQRIDHAALPAILILHDNRACVLLGWDEAGTQARLLLPETAQGAVTLSADKLAARYAGVTLFVRPHFRFDARTPDVRKTPARHW